MSYAKDFSFSVTVSVEVSFTKLAQLWGSVGMHMDFTLLHSCTCVSFVTELLCAHDEHFESWTEVPEVVAWRLGQTCRGADDVDVGDEVAQRDVSDAESVGGDELREPRRRNSSQSYRGITASMEPETVPVKRRWNSVETVQFW